MGISVHSLTIYPVKSCRGISLQASRVERRGLAHDRRWMLVDEHGSFLSQRRWPELALLSTSLHEAHYGLRTPDGQTFELPHSVNGGSGLEVSVFESRVEALEYAPASQWFSAVLGRACRAVHLPRTSLRPVSARYAALGDEVSFADGFPCLALSLESLAELNRRCPEPMSMARFRPNIVLCGGQPHFEDELGRFQVGSVTFRAPKLCERCKVTLIDPESAESGKEPLASLAEYRRWDGKVWFGVNLIPEAPGDLAVGDALSPLRAQPT